MINEGLYKSKIEEHNNFPIDGVRYYDLNPLYKNPHFRKILVDDCLETIKDGISTEIFPAFDYIAVVESRGFILGSILADKLDRGLVLLRSKPGRLPGDTSKVTHTLEYGDAQMECQKGFGKTLIFDDVLATGGTAKGAIECLTNGGYTPVGAFFPVELDYLKPELPIPYASIIQYGEEDVLEKED